jgi:hypothetical protein
MLVPIVAYAWIFGSGLMILRVLMYSSRDFTRQVGLTKGRMAMPTIVQAVFPHYPLDNGAVEVSLSVKVFFAFIFFVFNIFIGLIMAVVFPISMVIGLFSLLDAGYQNLRRRVKRSAEPANLRFVALMLQGYEGPKGVDRGKLYLDIIQHGEIMTSEQLNQIYYQMVSTVEPKEVPSFLKSDFDFIIKKMIKK